MVTLTIDGKTVTAREGTTILEAARDNGIHIPSLCYLKEINQIAACRICVVEIEGITRLMPACDNQVAEGMVIRTNSPRVREARRVNLQLILSQHDCRCATCVRSGNCTLQKLANDMNLLSVPYETELPIQRWNQKLPLIRNAAKCVKCMRCVQICDKVQGLHIWDVAGTGSRTTVNVSKNRKLEEADCAYCAQCVTHCPVGALYERDDTAQVLEALADPEIITVVQVAPAVRAAWAEDFGLPLDVATPGRMVSALKSLGFDYVYDTNFSADLTIMEEGSEFVERFTHKDQYPWPMFTSCCPGWVRFVKSQFPDFVPNLSTAKSPQQMFGAVAKTYFAEKNGIPLEKLKVISVMPCVSKKAESDLPTMVGADGRKDVDIVLTTRELARLLKSDHVNIQDLPEQSFDFPLGTGTGAAVIFGATGGVMDAALRSAYFLVTGRNPDADAFLPVRGMDGWKEAAFDIPGAGTVRVAVAHGLGNTRRLMEALQAGKVHYDFVEIMACPGGCAGGGGQPIHDGLEMAALRGSVLWELDKGSKRRFSHENPEVHALYAEYLEKPLSHRAHQLLHTDHTAWSMPPQAR
ncbi:MAG TPA: (2Fe-2S)-binding protein [Candidatus Avoscillospira avicola]|uniref:(2Fe-2S)-binding protein n=1 Tax=Candidatus Avoscillospira avicola TaxID=2840706 RepID=A0A9D1DI49_9FIRM|nr:(2Fe-2S)-binding protein [Candidatus Avoscillospira avicola]